MLSRLQRLLRFSNARCLPWRIRILWQCFFGQNLCTPYKVIQASAMPAKLCLWIGIVLPCPKSVKSTDYLRQIDRKDVMLVCVSASDWHPPPTDVFWGCHQQQLLEGGALLSRQKSLCLASDLQIQPAHVTLQGENFTFCIYKASPAAPVTCP